MRNLRSTVFSLHRQELMAATTLLPVYKQWRKDPGLCAIPFTTFVAGGITMTRSGWQASGEWNGDSGTVSLTGYSAQCATGNSVSSIGGSAIVIGQ